MDHQEKRQHLKLQNYQKIWSFTQEPIRKLIWEEALFIKKLEKCIGKYKGKLPLKWFNCGIIGHFATKCPYPKQEDSDDEENCKHKKNQKSKTIYKNKFNKKKKNVYSMEDSEDEEINENEEIIFMGIETQTLDDELDVEGEVDLEAELISALEEIEKCRRRNKYLKEKLSKCQEEKKSKEVEVNTL